MIYEHSKGISARLYPGNVDKRIPRNVSKYKMVSSLCL